jgi:type IX secretion system substrate protein
LLVGTFSGAVFLYDDLELSLPSLPFKLRDSSFFNLNWGKSVAVSGMINPWSKQVDYVLGSGRGGFKFYTADIKTGIGNPKGRQAIKIYPNPAHDWLDVTTDETVYDITVFDQTGRVVMQFKNTGQKKTRLHIGHMPAGIYFIRMQNDKMQFTNKFVKM